MRRCWQRALGEATAEVLYLCCAVVLGEPQFALDEVQLLLEERLTLVCGDRGFDVRPDFLLGARDPDLSLKE